MLKNLRKSEGFTLVELMVVVLIIGILVAIAIPVFNSAVGNARTNACKGSMRGVESAITIYDSGHADAPILTGGTYATEVALLVANKNLKSAPKCPDAGVYSFNAAGMVTCTKHGTSQD